jgi:hypothetical protein
LAGYPVEDWFPWVDWVCHGVQSGEMGVDAVVLALHLVPLSKRKQTLSIVPRLPRHSLSYDVYSIARPTFPGVKVKAGGRRLNLPTLLGLFWQSRLFDSGPSCYPGLSLVCQYPVFFISHSSSSSSYLQTDLKFPSTQGSHARLAWTQDAVISGSLAQPRLQGTDGGREPCGRTWTHRRRRDPVAVVPLRPRPLCQGGSDRDTRTRRWPC